MVLIQFVQMEFAVLINQTADNVPMGEIFSVANVVTIMIVKVVMDHNLLA
jgi:hypothetical protein